MGVVTNMYAYRVETKEKLKLPELNNQLQQVNAVGCYKDKLQIKIQHSVSLSFLCNKETKSDFSS